MLLFRLALFLLLLASQVRAQETPRPDALSDTLVLLRDAMASDPRVTDLSVDRTGMALHMRVDGQEFTAFPDNLHRQLRSAITGEERTDILRNHAAGTLESAGLDTVILGPDSLPNLRPVLRNLGLAGAGIGLADHPISVAHLSFAGDLAIFWVIDNEKSMAYVTEEMLEKSGLDVAALHQRALTNLHLLTPQVRLEDLSPTVVLLTYDTDYESSFALDPSLWRRFRGWRTLVMAAPTRGTLILADGEDDSTVAWLRETAKTISAEDGERMSGKLYSFDGTGWAAY